MFGLIIMILSKEMYEELMDIEEVMDIEEEIIEEVEDLDVLEEEELIEEIEDLDNLEKVKDSRITWKDNGDSYEIYKKNGFTVLKSLEPSPYYLLIRLVSTIGGKYYLNNCTNKERYIIWTLESDAMSIAESWWILYPQFDLLYKNYGYAQHIHIKVSDVPKNIRKILRDMNFTDFSKVLDILEDCIHIGIHPNKIEKILRESELFTIISIALQYPIREEILQRCNKDELIQEMNRIDEQQYENDEDEELTEEEQNKRNYRYCSYMDKYHTIPYYDEWYYEDYIIYSPKKYIELAQESERMHNCVGQEEQNYVSGVRNKTTKIFFLKKQEKNIATICIENNALVECREKYNKSLKYDNEIVIRKWLQSRNYEWDF